ncbi:MAG: ParB/RepB/Spo0J family partition protein [Ottowia sp.]|nr:ParB/RepB/Spo0J family partition protein [Ottowia sp.]
MSIKDRLAQKTAGIIAPTNVIEKGTQNTSSSAPKTGPGQMLAFRSHMQENSEKVTELEERLKAFEGATPIKIINPKKVRPSKWANRHEHGFESTEFAQLKADLLISGGNVQPIKVRRISDPSGQFEYELVFGHRRHRACLEEDLPLMALIDDLSDRDLFKAMDFENRSRLDLSPWEKGVMYRRALDDGLYPSLRKMAGELGVDHSNMSKAISLARLPEEIVKAFPSPLDIQFRWASLLSDRLQKHPEKILELAKSFSVNKPHNLTSKEVFEKLVGIQHGYQNTQEVKAGGKTLAKISHIKGKVSVHFEKHALTTEQIKKLPDVLAALLNN